ncbi:NAD(P)/FAD-dependent oxidoreductase [Paludisphaera rhizosphaerae]|uniref:NAD(P)/FAD-dependent oxidoreductase n=1 Tax=Paludisphaera rhizosphaerae TaxID=2711216 RepID=UPI0013EB94EE|nr:FAD-dependent oxidoreductase [Paludisphaera rhizosphaerae]
MTIGAGLPSYDVVVAGAGPAGAMTARELARRGVRVLLVDRAEFPRTKVCGCCLNPRALAALGRTGLGELTARLRAVPLTGIELATCHRRAAVDHDLGVAVSRESFDAALVDAAVAAGAEFQPRTSARLIVGSSPGCSRLRLNGEGRSFEVAARFVVSATGLADSLFAAGSRTSASPKAKLGAGAIVAHPPAGFQPGRIYMACGREGYVGLVVLEDGRLDLAAALNPVAVREAGGIGALAASILGKSRFPAVPRVDALPWKGTALLTRSPDRLVESGVLRVGDSAGYVEPFTGEGMAWALTGGEALATILAESISGLEDSPAARWSHVYRTRIARRQLVCRAASRALRTPWMTRTLVRCLEYRPSLARPLLSVMHKAP